jgi:hypothetical protein
LANARTGLAAAHTFTFANLVADADGSGTVDVGDLGILATNFNRSPRTVAQGDFDGSGRVDVADLGALATNFNRSLPAGNPGVVQSRPRPAAFTAAPRRAGAWRALRDDEGVERGHL